MTQYYCFICGSTITEGEHRYSKDIFGKALCRVHQEIERNTQSNRNTKSLQEIEIKQSQKPNESKVIEKESKIGLSGIVKKAGKVLKKGATTVVDTTRKGIQRREWKDKILMRLGPQLIKQLARENRIHPDVDRPTDDDYFDAVKNRVPLDDIETFAKRNHVNIRDILTEREYAKAKEETKQMSNDGTAINEFFEQVLREIRLFQPSGSYDNELPYHMELKGYLQGKLPNAQIDIERYRGSSKPDITIDGIAIEVKGPTGERELQTIMEKCVRYCPSHPKGVIIVLFNVSVSPYRYEDWFKGMNNRFPEVKIITKNK